VPVLLMRTAQTVPEHEGVRGAAEVLDDDAPTSAVRGHTPGCPNDARADRSPGAGDEPSPVASFAFARGTHPSRAHPQMLGDRLCASRSSPASTCPDASARSQRATSERLGGVVTDARKDELRSFTWRCPGFSFPGRLRAALCAPVRRRTALTPGPSGHVQTGPVLTWKWEEGCRREVARRSEATTRLAGEWSAYVAHRRE
jgi:hypothetical protein